MIITATEHFTPASAFPEERPDDDQERGSRVLCTDYKCSVLCLVAVWFLVFLLELLKEGCYRDTIAHFYSTPGQGTESPTNSSLMTGLSHYTGTRSAVDRHWEAFDSVWEGSHDQRGLQIKAWRERGSRPEEGGLRSLDHSISPGSFGLVPF